jgi:CheY-specific phosphatase CheX
MQEASPKVARVMDSAIAQIRAYLEAELGLHTQVQPAQNGIIDALKLREMTSIIGVNGAIELFVAFSFAESLVEVLYQQMTEGMEIAPDEVEELKKAAVAEIMNIVIGHCTTDLQDMSPDIINITPPNVLSLVKIVPRLKNAEFYQRSVETDFGPLDVFLIGPKELFSQSLDYLN